MFHAADTVILVSYYAVLFGLAVYGSHRLMLVFLYYRTRHCIPRPGGILSPLPKVTVQLPMYNERYVVERLIDSVAKIDYPRELLEIQVLDDSNDETSEMARAAVERHRLRGVNIHYLHRDHRAGFKAGALQEGLCAATGEFLLVLDADFIPDPGIIRDSIDFFFDPHVGMVQSRWDHLNRDFSLLTKIQSIYLDGHFVLEHTARNRSGRFFNFNGTAGIWRRRTIEESGGWMADTLTEDLDLSYRAQLANWKFVYLKDVVSPAEVPVDVSGFKSQQHRWAKGSIQTGLKLLRAVFQSRFPLKVKIESFFHLTNNISYPLVVALSFLIFPAMVIRHNLGWTKLILFDAPLFLISTLSVITFYVVAQREIDPRWRKKLRYMPMVMALGIGLAVNNTHAVLEALLGGKSEFRRTPKYSIVDASQKWKHKSYRTGSDIFFPIEVAFALYFALVIGLALLQRIYLALPFLMIFFSGYFYIVLLSVLQRIERPRRALAGLRVLGLPAAAGETVRVPALRTSRTGDVQESRRAPPSGS
jgi:cellulose synthase/poly-beta-1,6-N-acetylglucosamine synthase-like glycosyltransferase